MKSINRRYLYLLLGLFFAISVAISLIQKWTPVTEIVFPDKESICIEKVALARESLLPETVIHGWNRLLNRTGIKPLPAPLAFDEERPVVTHSGNYRNNPDYKTIPTPNGTGEFLFVWFSLSDPQSMMPPEALSDSWREERYFCGFNTGPYIDSYTTGFQKYLSLKDEHGCTVSSAYVSGILRNDGKFLLCAVFPIFNRFSAKTQLTLNFVEKYSASFNIPLPPAKKSEPLKPPPLPQSVILPDKVVMHLDSWKFQKSETPSYIENDASGIIFNDGFYPKGIATIHLSKENQATTDSYGYDLCPIGDALGNADDIACADSPGWFLRGNAYLTDLSKIPKNQKLVIENILPLKDGEAREVPLPENSFLRHAYLLGTGIYFLDETGIKHYSPMDKEKESLDFISATMSGKIREDWDWAEELRATGKARFPYFYQAFRIEKPTMVFSIYPQSKRMKLVVHTSAPSSFSTPFKWIRPQIGVADPSHHAYYDVVITTGGSLSIGLTEKYPFSFFFATDETMQQDAKAILIHK